MQLETKDRFSGCLLAGAVGDALGVPVEFLTLAEIRTKYGPEGIRTFTETPSGIGIVSDDTQMTLFTAEGLLSEYHLCRAGGSKPDYSTAVYRSYLRWLHTQGEVSQDPAFRDCLGGELLKVPELNHRRGPGSTCLSSLISGRIGTVASPINTGKGCGGVMRVAPAGLFCRAIPGGMGDRERAAMAFELGCAVAAVTHGHPLGYLPAGYLAAVMFFLTAGLGLEEAQSKAMLLLVERPESEKGSLAALIARALRSAQQDKPSPETLERLGAGWVADEALAISLYCAASAKGDLATGLRLAVNHSGDSDSTGAITGNILGALLGKGAIPEAWLTSLEMRELLEKISMELFAVSQKP
ncbi:MAG: ADP-ribosylglycohydrolase family protein [Deltaproteobacteria bacterium]|nr:ADP-ribosylglycohydrolase family protein [Deltaproteobacteria bacterium]TLN04205.1 MAG: ADP-ribosylglycohydrolase family protein [bacterium]